MQQLGTGCSVTGAAGAARGVPGPGALCWGERLAQRGCQQLATGISWEQEHGTQGDTVLCLLMPQPWGDGEADPPLSPKSCCALQRGWGCTVSAQSSVAPCGGHCHGARPAWAAVLCCAVLGRGQGRWGDPRRGCSGLESAQKMPKLAELCAHAD